MKDQEPKARGVAVTFLRFINKRNPGQILVLGFLTVIVLGSLLLMLPVATVDRTFLGPVDALFTATSAVCVTGLTVVNTGVTFSLYGQDLPDFYGHWSPHIPAGAHDHKGIVQFRFPAGHGAFGAQCHYPYLFD